MKPFDTIAALAVLTTLAACSGAEAPAEAPAIEVANTEAANDDAGTSEAEKTGGQCGDGTVLGENEQCK